MSRYGRLPRTRDQRDYLARPSAVYTGAYVNLESGFPPPWDQGQLGSCVAFGSAGAVAFARAKMGLAGEDLSELFVYYAARERGGYPTDQDTGLEIRDGFASLAHDGVPPASDWPYDISRFTQKPPNAAWTDAAQDEAMVYGAIGPDAVDDIISSGYPVVIGFDVYESFESQRTADTGVMPVPARGEQLMGGHCVVLVSTPKDGAGIAGGVPGTLYRRARNSWSTLWGDGGYFWFPLPAMVHASDFWEIQTVNSPNPPAPPPPTPHDAIDDALVAALDPWARERHVGDNHAAAAAYRKWRAAKNY